MSVFQLTIAASILTLWAVALWWRDGFALPRVTKPTIKLTHVLPACLQATLFTYWSLYWPEVFEHVPILGVQLGFAYAFDLLLAWTLRRPYSIGFGPVPVVLSANLFVWFQPGNVLFYAVMIALALSSKTFIRVNGRHIFNPSVFGITVIALLCILLPHVFQYRDISHDFDRPPDMALVIIGLSLIPQIRLRTAPVSVGVVCSMVGTMLIVFMLTGYRGGPSPWWPPWLLAVTLLAPDPATIPSATLSRLFFGLFLGVAFYVLSRALLFSVGTDFFSKVIPIPIANLLVPSFERIGARVSSRWPNLDRDIGNRAYVAAWVTMSVLMLIVGHSA
jgi:hypothetical protein